MRRRQGGERRHWNMTFKPPAASPKPCVLPTPLCRLHKGEVLQNVCPFFLGASPSLPLTLWDNPSLSGEHWEAAFRRMDSYTGR